MHSKKRYLGLGGATCLLIILIFAPLRAQEQTVGLFYHDPVNSYNGYTLFAPRVSTDTYLIDNDGQMVHSWESDVTPSGAPYLLENGDLLRCGKVSEAPGGGDGGLLQVFDWDGTLIWEYVYSTATYWQHHDLEPLPNGNVLVLAYEVKTDAEAIAAGRDPSILAGDQLWPEHIVEVEPTGPTSGVIVWEWHLWDHLIQDFDSTRDNYGTVEEHPELMDINFTLVGGPADWLHANSVGYNPDLDQIVISLRRLSEFWVIDHSTTTAEAAGHTGGNTGMGGDIIYRWGNPIVYRAGTIDDQKLIGQHDARWVEPGFPGAGDITVFSNGRGRPGGEYATIEQITPPVDVNGNYPQPPAGTPHDPAEQTWVYTADPPESFFSRSGSGAHRLPNGNTIACEARKGRFTEVTPAGDIVWEYLSPIAASGPTVQGEPVSANTVFRVHRYAPDYPGLVGQDLTPKGPLEIYLISITDAVHTPLVPTDADSVVVTATMTFTTYSEISTAEMYVDTGNGFSAIPMFDDGNHHDGAAGDSVYGAVIPPVSDLTNVSYYLYASDDSSTTTADPPGAPGATYGYTVGYLPPRIYLNELMADNDQCCTDEYGDYDGWIELYNAETVDVNLTGMYLSDDLANSAKFLIGDTTIPAGGFIVFWADDETGEGLNHTNFVLGMPDGAIGLFDSDAHGNRSLDSLSYAAQEMDVSYGRFPEETDNWMFLITPTPGGINDDCNCTEFGDLNLDGGLDPVDVVLLVTFVYRSVDVRQQIPTCPGENGDWDCDGEVNPVDVVTCVNFVYRGWATGPCNPCTF